MNKKIEILETDLLIIGGGAAGLYSAITLGRVSDKKVIVVDKGNVKRSGCLAAGVNALNGYLNKGETKDSYVDYIKSEANGIVREDLSYTIGEKLNTVTNELENMGLSILKDEHGNYVSRGKRSIKINGENIKLILEREVKKYSNINILNYINIVDYVVLDNRVIGAVGFSIKEEKFYLIYSKATICTTGGASGIYKPNRVGNAKHKMWYSPFNTGAGYAMGIRAGAEMTSFELRFIALRLKDTIAPTGTIAQGIKAKQINKNGEEYVEKYGDKNTVNRLYSTVEESKKGNGPCYLKTIGIEKEMEFQLIKAYLNMAPSQSLKWIDNKKGPSKENVEIVGTEPYIVGGHGPSGYWVDINRKTTLNGLYAAGDVVGGSPKKYVTGALVEGEIASKNALKYINKVELAKLKEKEEKLAFEYMFKFLDKEESTLKINEIEEEMQEIMDKYAGGIGSNYEYSSNSLNLAEEYIDNLIRNSQELKALDNHELMFIFEVIDRLLISKVLIKHLKARKETRLRSYGEYIDYPNIDENYSKYINSIYKDGQVKIMYKDLIKRGDFYEH